MSESKLIVTIDGSQAETSAKRLEGELGKLEAAGTKAADSVGKVGDGAEQSVSKMDRLKGMVTTLAAGFTAIAGVAVARTFVNVAMETDRLKGSLETMTGSTEKAGLAFKALESFAAKTPYSVDQAVEAFIKLKALGLDPSERSLTSFGNTAAAMGKSLSQMIEAVADATTGEFERLKEFGIKSSVEGDRVKFTFQGVTTEIGKNADEIQKYLVGLGETKFGDAMANQMDKLPGLFSNLQDEVMGVFRAFGDAGGNAVIASVLKGLIAIADAIGKTIPIAMGYLKSAALTVFGAIDVSVTRLGYNVKILAQQFKKLWDPAAVAEIDRLTRARDAEVAGIQQMTAELKDETVNAGYAANATADLSEVVDQSTTAANNNSRAVENQTGKIKGLTAAQKERREDEMLAIFQKAESDKGLYETTKAVESQTKAMREQTAELDPWAESVKGAAERVDAAFVDMWRNIGSGFGSFADSLKSAFSQLLAELAHMAITKPIVMSFASSLGIGGTTSAGGAGGISNLISMGKAGYSWLTGAGGTGAGLGASIGSMYGGMADVFGSLGMTGAEKAALNQYFGYSGATGLEAAKGIGTNLIAGYAGSQLAGSLMSSRESTGFGSMAGGFVGSIWGPIGTFVGSAVGEAVDRALGGSDFTGKRVKLGVGTGSMVNSSDWENVRTLASGLRVGNLRQRAGDAGMSGEQQNAYLATFDRLDSTLTDIARSMGANVDFSKIALPGMPQKYDGGVSGGAFFGSLAKGELRDTLTRAPDEFVRQWLVAIDSELSTRVKGIMGDTGGKTAEQLIGLFGFAADIDRLLNIDVLKTTADTAKAATRTVYDLYGEATEQVITLAHTYDGTAASMSALTDALGIQKTIAMQLAQQYQELAASTSALLTDTKTQIIKSTMTQDELYNNARNGFYFTQLALKATTDPAQIAALTAQGNQQIKDAWANATPEQQKLLQGEFIQLLDNMNTLVQQQIGIGQAALGDREKATAGAVDFELINKAAGTQSEAAAKQEKSADTMSAAVDRFGAWVSQLPGSITVNLGNLIPSEVNA